MGPTSNQGGRLMRIWTIQGQHIEKGANVSPYQLQSGVIIAALLIGEKGRGRALGVLPVEGVPVLPCPERGTHIWLLRGESYCCRQCGQQYDERGRHPPTGTVYGRLYAARIGQTRAGNAKLIACHEKHDRDKEVLVVLRTRYPHRGRAYHTGGAVSWGCRRLGCPGKGQGVAPPACPVCGGTDLRQDYAPVPGRILTQGTVASGEAGHSAHAPQLAVVVPPGAVLRVVRWGPYTQEAYTYRIDPDGPVLSTEALPAASE